MQQATHNSRRSPIGVILHHLTSCSVPSSVFVPSSVLRRAGIGINEFRNLAIAINQRHSKAYAKAVFKTLRDAQRRSSNQTELTNNVAKALNRIAKILGEGNPFQ
ncbi:AHH domain-containing protein [Novipirellula aureliae]|uniref:AHH domain-containing protein n=1 Tax=Novipirellula aureliae TaxID=2527966 RepID=UPI0018CE314A